MATRVQLALCSLAMADSRSEVIRSKLIGDGLNAFRDTFKSLCEDLELSTPVDELQHIGHESTYNGLYMALSLTDVCL